MAEETGEKAEFWYTTQGVQPHRAYLIGVFRNKDEEKQANEHVDELKQLVTTYQIPIVGAWCTSLRDVSSSTFLSSGKVEQLKQQAKEAHANLIIFDDEISPVQQRNLEQALQLPVMDRAEVILGVFAAHAKTHEAKMQIELAQLQYMAPRLKRLWTHLSRQTGGGGGAGGGGYLKGAGEKQIEIDRRLIKHRMEQLEKELKRVKETRHTQKRRRTRLNIPVFAIVGYTNAGKSSLMNRCTNADVLVENKLFATLDTTTRHLLLPNHQEVLLSDTVGFIRKLPHLLVASFKSTLEEAADADYLIHVVDTSHPQAIDQAKTTMEVLHELHADKVCITLLNKIDQIEGPEGVMVRTNLQKLRLLYSGAIPFSAKTGEGVSELYDAMVRVLKERVMRVELRIPQEQYQAVADALSSGTLFSKAYEENDVLLDIELPKALAMKYFGLFGQKSVRNSSFE